MYGRIIQTVGVIAVVVALEIEVWSRQEVWLILATVGSLIFAVGTKFVYFSSEKKGGD